MKKRVFVMTLALATLVCLLCALGGMACAESKTIGVGVTYAVGDTVVLPNDRTWLLLDDDPYWAGWDYNDPFNGYAWKDYKSAGSYEVTEITKTSTTSSQGKITLQSRYPLEIYAAKPTDKLADDPIGFRIKSGSGTEADPYTFEFVYDLNQSSFTVYFDSNGASGYKNPVSDVSGSYTLPQPGNSYSWPGSDPHDFVGWRVGSATAGTIYQPGQTINVTANVTLYAQWQQRAVTLTVQNGTATFNGVTASTLTGLHAGDQVTLTADAPPAGQVFQNWDTDYGSFSDRSAATTTFTMPGRDAKPWVNYKDAIETCRKEIANESVTLYAWEGSTPLPSEAGAWFLPDNVTLSSTWVAPSGTTYLCLHGHAITMNGNGPAIRVPEGATLYLVAHYQNNNTAEKLSHASGKSGCGIEVSGGTLHTEIVRISGNPGGGIVVSGGSAVIANRTQIDGNGSGTINGGGICVSGGSVFYEDGSMLYENTAAMGGGVYVSGGSFSTDSGTIHDNTAGDGFEVYVAGGSFRVGYYADPGSVYLADGQRISFLNRALESSVCISVGMENSGEFTSGLNRKGTTANFVSADQAYAVTLSAAGESQLTGKSLLMLPPATQSIGESAFEGDESLMLVYVPDSCASIGKNAFKGCTGLMEIRLPKDCDIDNSAFDGCTALSMIYAPAYGSTHTWAQAHNIPFTAE